MAFRAVQNPSGRALIDKPTTLGASLGTQVDQPVGLPDDVGIVFNNNDRMAPVNQAVKDPHESTNIFKVKTGTGFIEYVKRSRTVPSPQFLRDLQALGLAPGQGCGTLAQTEIGKTHIPKTPQ